MMIETQEKKRKFIENAGSIVKTVYKREPSLLQRGASASERAARR
jgi:hypothetical protein